MKGLLTYWFIFRYTKDNPNIFKIITPLTPLIIKRGTKSPMQHIVGLKELRQNTAKYIRATEEGRSFIIVKQSKPLFKITPLDNDEWEEVIDFTKIKKGGVAIHDLLKRL